VHESDEHRRHGDGDYVVVRFRTLRNERNVGEPLCDGVTQEQAEPEPEGGRDQHGEQEERVLGLPWKPCQARRTEPPEHDQKRQDDRSHPKERPEPPFRPLLRRDAPQDSDVVLGERHAVTHHDLPLAQRGRHGLDSVGGGLPSLVGRAQVEVQVREDKGLGEAHEELPLGPWHLLEDRPPGLPYLGPRIVEREHPILRQQAPLGARSQLAHHDDPLLRLSVELRLVVEDHVARDAADQLQERTLILRCESALDEKGDRSLRELRRLVAKRVEERLLGGRVRILFLAMEGPTSSGEGLAHPLPQGARLSLIEVVDDGSLLDRRAPQILRGLLIEDLDVGGRLVASVCDLPDPRDAPRQSDRAESKELRREQRREYERRRDGRGRDGTARRCCQPREPSGLPDSVRRHHGISSPTRVARTPE
jgi:hypothetical protein